MAEFVPPQAPALGIYQSFSPYGDKASQHVSQNLSQIAVRYENLSAQTLVAEFQKDILVQMLHERFPGVSSFPDVNETSGTSPKDTVLTIRCDQCSYANDTTLLVEKSLQKTLQSQDEELISFRTATPNGKTPTWKVALRTGGNRYFIALQLPVSFSRPLQEGEPLVQTCDSTSRCNLQNSFASAALANAQLNKIKSSQATRLLAANMPLHASDLVVAPLVKQSDQVRVVYRAHNSGLKVNARGRALTSGTTGQNVRVELYAFSGNTNGTRPASSGRIIEGVVTGPLEVEYAP